MRQAVWLALAMVGLAGGAWAQDAPSTAPFRPADLQHPKSVSREACAALPSRVFVTVAGTGQCISYFATSPGAGWEGGHALIEIPGDMLVDDAKGRLQPVWDYGQISPAMLVNYGKRRGEGLGVPVITLGRLGIYGSSGRHLDRHSVYEADVASAALDAIKAKFGFAGFHLIGQSGGGLVAAGLAARRQDLGCVMLVSTPLDLKAMARKTGMHYKMPAPLVRLDPITEVTRVAAGTRVVVVTDRRDQVVPAEAQTGYVPALTARNVNARQVFSYAADPERHDLLESAYFQVPDCIGPKP